VKLPWVGAVGPSAGDRPPLEIRLAVRLLVASGLVFVAVGVLRLIGEGGTDLLWTPLTYLVLAIGVAAGLYRGHRAARPVGLGFALLAALLQLLIAFGQGPGYARVVAGMLTAALVYTAVLISTKPAIEHTGGTAPRRLP
jgi:hypothetical protein